MSAVGSVGSVGVSFGGERRYRAIPYGLHGWWAVFDRSAARVVFGPAAERLCARRANYLEGTRGGRDRGQAQAS